MLWNFRSMYIFISGFKIAVWDNVTKPFLYVCCPSPWNAHLQPSSWLSCNFLNAGVVLFFSGWSWTSYLSRSEMFAWPCPTAWVSLALCCTRPLIMTLWPPWPLWKDRSMTSLSKDLICWDLFECNFWLLLMKNKCSLLETFQTLQFFVSHRLTLLKMTPKFHKLSCNYQRFWKVTIIFVALVLSSNFTWLRDLAF